MEYIPNTEYITINKDGCFIGSRKVVGKRGDTVKPTLFYGYEIQGYDLDVALVYVQKAIPEIEEIHVGAFDTAGEINQPGFPSGKIGRYLWCRVKLKNKDATFAPWIFHLYDSCARSCVYYGWRFCVVDLRRQPEFASALLRAANTEQKTIVSDTEQKMTVSESNAPVIELKQKLQSIDLSKLVGKTVELNGYKIQISKITQNEKTTKPKIVVTEQKTETTDTKNKTVKPKAEATEPKDKKEEVQAKIAKAVTKTKAVVASKAKTEQK